MVKSTQCSGDTQELADLAFALEHTFASEMVEVCSPHPDNPAKTIWPVQRRKLAAALRTTHSPSEAEGRALDEWLDCGNLGWCERDDEAYCIRHNPDGWADAKRALSLPSKTVELLREAQIAVDVLERAIRFGIPEEQRPDTSNARDLRARIDSHLGEMK